MREPQFHIGVRVGTELDARIEVRAKAEKCSRSEVVRHALEFYLADSGQSLPAREKRPRGERKAV